jgi:hypothetical protein
MVWPRILASLAALAAGACAQNPAFALSDGADAGTHATPTDTTSTTGVTTTATEPDMSSGTGSGATVTDATTTSLTLTTGALDDSSSTTGDTTTGAPAGPATCGQAKDMGMPTGITELAEPDGSISVWCEQELADGGWMLVARSAKDGKARAFGWTHDLGDPAAVSEPYSLDAVGLGLPMTQILVGVRDDGNKPVKTAYALTVPADFLTSYADAPAKVSTVFTVLGQCNPPGGPTMLQWAGYTDANDRFRLRDLQNDINDLFGLRADGFQLNYPGCPFGANLQEFQGVMFVR